MSACQFVRLQKVVCLVDDWHEEIREPGDIGEYDGPHPERGEVCKIMSILPGPEGHYLILDGYGSRPKYLADKFRPFRKGDPDIGDFHAILDLVNAGLRVRAC